MDRAALDGGWSERLLPCLYPSHRVATPATALGPASPKAAKAGAVAATRQQVRTSFQTKFGPLLQTMLSWMRRLETLRSSQVSCFNSGKSQNGTRIPFLSRRQAGVHSSRTHISPAPTYLQSTEETSHPAASTEPRTQRAVKVGESPLPMTALFVRGSDPAVSEP